MIPKYRVWCKNKNEWEKDTCYIQQDGLLYQRACGSERLIPLLEKNHVITFSTGFHDEQGRNIFIGDFTELIVDGEKRIFEVKNKQVTRQVKSHPSFIDDYAKVTLEAVVFVWKGFELFPCVDNAGIIDTSKMRIVGNIFETPELQKLH